MREMYLGEKKLAEWLVCVKCSINVGVFPSFLENSCLEEVGRKLDCEDSRCFLGKARTPEPGAVQEPCGAGRGSRRWGQWGKAGSGCFPLPCWGTRLSPQQPLRGQPWEKQQKCILALKDILTEQGGPDTRPET